MPRNLPKACTPAIALCKEPSQEHRRYLQELVEAGVDMDLVDEQGYTALDHAVFNGDTVAEELVLKGLRHKFDGDVEAKVLQRQMQAKLRKGYRELFQEKLRLVLLGGSDSDDLQNLRHVYADALAAEGLGVSDFVYRISHYSCFGGFRHGFETMVCFMHDQATWPWRETVHNEECIYTAPRTAIALQSIHLFQSHCIFFRPPTVPVYIATSHSRSISNRYGSFLSAGAMGLNMPLQASVWPTPSGEIAQTLLQLLSS